MSEARRILYAGYGANRDPQMIKEITGEEPKVIGSIAILDVELCVQTVDQIPDVVSESAPAPLSPKEIIVASWGEESGFETYTIRNLAGLTVQATLFELSKQERELISNWEMSKFGWYKPMQVATRQEDGTMITAETEGLWSGQEVDRAVDGNDYPTYLNEPEDMYEIARRARQEFLGIA